jgi:hypothetical protein
MYVKNVENYFHNFRRPTKYSTMKTEIAIENGWSLELHQMLSTLCRCSPAHSSTTTKHTWPVPSLPDGTREEGFWGG